jgi:hypothetical protein
MANLAFEQLVIIAQQLAELDEKMKELKAKDAEFRTLALELLQESGENSAKTLFGTITRCKGKTQKTYTSEEYLEAKENLEIAKIKAENRNQYTTTTGAPYIRFAE